MKGKISIIIAESGLETIPIELQKNNSILSYSRKVGKKPKELLLDISYHYSAMKNGKIENMLKRGRPDLIHFGLLEILSAPMYQKKLVDVYIHTINNNVITIGNNVRMPKTYARFEGLMIKLFQDKIISVTNSNDHQNMLLLLENNITFEDLVKKINSNKIIGFSSRGVLQSIDKIAKEVFLDDIHCVLVFGGFQRGHFNQYISNTFDKIYSISNSHLELHTVIARVIYELEKYRI
ncbi:MAG: ribosome biogenesis protein [Nitrososphaeraceae archaeon]